MAFFSIDFLNLRCSTFREEPFLWRGPYSSSIIQPFAISFFFLRINAHDTFQFFFLLLSFPTVLIPRLLLYTNLSHSSLCVRCSSWVNNIFFRPFMNSLFFSFSLLCPVFSSSTPWIYFSRAFTRFPACGPFLSLHMPTILHSLLHRERVCGAQVSAFYIRFLPFCPFF